MGISVLHRPTIIGAGKLSSKTITSNGTYYASSDNVKGYSEVTVDVRATDTIDWAGFFGRTISEFSVPANVKEICQGAFSGCSKLQSVYLNNVELLQQYTFSNCRSITTFSAPNLIQALYNDIPAFSNATLRELSLPRCVYLSSQPMHLSQASFPALNAIVNSPIYASTLSNNPYSEIFYAQGIVFEQCSWDSIYFSQLCTGMPGFRGTFKNLDLPDLLSCGRWFAGSCTGLQNVSLPKLLAMSGSNCFLGCTNLEKIELPNLFWISQSGNFSQCQKLSIASFPNLLFGDGSNMYTFYNCYRLETFYAPYLSSLSAGSLFFALCSSLKKFEAPMYGSRFYSSFFSGCSALSQVICGCSVIEASTFLGASSLAELIILNASSVNLVNTNAFAGTPMSDSSYLGHFGSIYVPSKIIESIKTSTNWVAYSDRIFSLTGSYVTDYVFAREFFGDTTITSIPNDKVNARAILERGFGGCKNLENVSLSNAEIIGAFAFSDCSSLSDVYIPNAKYIGPSAFIGTTITGTLNIENAEIICSTAFNVGIHSIVGGSKIKFLGANGFSSTFFSSEINFPNLICCNHTFSWCTCSKVSFPKLESVGVQGFLGSCTNLSAVYFPELKKIETMCFNNCTNLSVAYFPKLTYLAPNYAFVGATKLQSIYFGRFVILASTIEMGFLSSTNSNLKIYVPEATIKVFQNYSIWSRFSSRFVGLTDEELAQAFADAANL